MYRVSAVTLLTTSLWVSRSVKLTQLQLPLEKPISVRVRVIVAASSPRLNMAAALGDVVSESCLTYVVRVRLYGSD
mgnify:CR=1 FL=1